MRDLNTAVWGGGDKWDIVYIDGTCCVPPCEVAVITKCCLVIPRNLRFLTSTTYIKVWREIWPTLFLHHIYFKAVSVHLS